MARPKSLNRKHDDKYKRVESYITEETKKKLKVLKSLCALSTSELIELLIENEYALMVDVIEGE